MVFYEVEFYYKMNKLVSIIVPCYNQAIYLNECLHSVLNQTYKAWECIIVNDGSLDDTEQIALKWCAIDSRFNYQKKTNGGLSSARNFGIILAKGDWVQLLDCDDLIEKDKIYHQIKMSPKFNAQILISGYRYFNNTEGNSALRIMGRNNLIPDVNIQEEDKIDLINLFQITNPFVISAPLYNKSVFEKVGLFDESFNALEDWDFHLRCAEKGIKFQHTGYKNQNKTLIRIHDSSMMGSNQRMEEAYSYFVKKHKITNNDNLQKKSRSLKSIVRLLTPPVIFSFYHYFKKNGN